ncbi:Y+L amino acid transporter [Orbilia ellipsospora]|uniref:Y+L amino acid transporter n=1 Tax=Orbilia ellipsospora TaxID=2528407 RepID=A0AAV9X0K8_9PEZI
MNGRDDGGHGPSQDFPDSPTADEYSNRDHHHDPEELLISDEEYEEQLGSSGISDRVPRSLTFFHGLALVIGLQIGSGIFSAPAAVRTHVPSTGVAMLAWVVGGIMASTGAASFATLGKLVPLNGGMQEYLRFVYFDLFGFLFAWTWIFVSRPLALAMISLVFSGYLSRAIYPEEAGPDWLLKTFAIFAVAVITLLNCIGTRIGTGVGNVFLFLKLLGLGSVPLLGIIAIAFLKEKPAEISQVQLLADLRVLSRDTPGPQNGVLDIWAAFGGFVDAVLAAAFAYNGWESLSFVGGEIKNPEVTLPKILKISMAIVITMFLASNLAIYLTVSAETLRDSDAPALEFGKKILGRAGVLFYTWVVCICALGSLNSIVFSTSRLTQAAGERNYLPRFLKANAGTFGGTNRWLSWSYLTYAPIRSEGQNLETDNVPRNAMIFNFLLAAVYIMTASFRSLLTFKGLIELTMFFLTVFGLVIFQFLHRQSEHGARFGIETISPIIFSVLASFILMRSAAAHSLEFSLILFGLWFSSIIYYKEYENAA